MNLRDEPERDAILDGPQARTISHLEKIIQRIVEVAHPLKIVLFGSRAWDRHRPDSDLDLLVIKESSEPRYERAVPIYRALVGLGVGVDKDIVVYTPKEVEQWRNANAHFVTTAVREGKVIYERQS
jgi:predicted nucleotidyltransferase